MRSRAAIEPPTVHAWLAYDRVGREAENQALTLARPETLVRGQVTEPQDVITVLGNLIDNAVNAAVAGSSPDRWVELEVLDEPHDDGGSLHIVVADSGDGLAAGTDAEAVFAEGFTTAASPVVQAPAAAGGRTGGLGLALARKLARRRGGDDRRDAGGTRDLAGKDNDA
ncbi:histidine kinase [Arthrobacter sp. Hiyo4]|nr:histidine kinase [Arthrobacter sp. Hiyo4]